MASDQTTITAHGPRRSGVLLHPTSLPGPHGSGDFGPAALRFVDWLVQAGQSLWQMLPLTPIGPGNSPYMSVSAFAGSPLLIALEPLIERGWLAPPTADEIEEFSAQPIDYGAVIPFRIAKLRAAFAGFQERGSAQERDQFDRYCQRERDWLDDYALFMALDAEHGGRVWPEWQAGVASREPRALADARGRLAPQVRFWQFVQWQFDAQWQAVKRYANERSIDVLGDMPIFVAHHSADCWAQPQLYRLDARGYPAVIAGVPPDFFSTTGQRWGNPLYDWDAMARDGYSWWISRMKRQLALADIVRIDHFRGFAAYWEIPASCPTAVEGRWVTGPGAALFSAIDRALGKLPIIAEDLGVITPDVVALRDQFHFPGMRILEFAFSGDVKKEFLPHNYVPNTVVYTGTHDNDTVLGWWATCTEEERAYTLHYLASAEPDIHWAMIHAACASVAYCSVCQFQDVLGLDGRHRMNTPAKEGCWEWRYAWDMVNAGCAEKLAGLCRTYER